MLAERNAQKQWCMKLQFSAQSGTLKKHFLKNFGDFFFCIQGNRNKVEISSIKNASNDGTSGRFSPAHVFCSGSKVHIHCFSLFIVCCLTSWNLDHTQVPINWIEKQQLLIRRNISYFYDVKNRHSYRQSYTDRHTDTQTDRQTDTQTDTQTDKQTDRQTETQRERSNWF